MALKIFTTVLLALVWLIGTRRRTEQAWWKWSRLFPWRCIGSTPDEISGDSMTTLDRIFPPALSFTGQLRSNVAYESRTEPPRRRTGVLEASEKPMARYGTQRKQAC